MESKTYLTGIKHMNGIHYEAKTFGNIVGLSNPRIGGIEVVNRASIIKEAHPRRLEYRSECEITKL
jgi:hypothetical protein